jgi:hypothetical protein
VISRLPWLRRATLPALGPATYIPIYHAPRQPRAAYRTARILALLALTDAHVQLDAEAVTRSLEELTRRA